ncbi:MAG: mevalonate kinase [Polyangiaceae bacterium]|nr:mevalonate kinase [Polyangiaceae bacterium]
MTPFEGRAAGKVILLGEHAVVYGVPGIAAGIERGARAQAEVRQVEDGVPPSSAASTLTLGGQTYRPGDGSDLGRAFAALLDDQPAIATLMDVTAEAELPPGGGLGCSAALGVAIARAALAADGRPAVDNTDASVISRAQRWEDVFHGNASGIDAAAAAVGACLRFERGKGTTPLAAPIDLWLAVGYSGSSASTKEMVGGIAKLKDRKPDLHQKFLDGVESLVKNAILAIQAGDALALGRFMDMNQMLLAGVFLSTEAIEAMCRVARESGALGVKLTGSGGGGSVIALGGASDPGATGTEAEHTAQRVRDAWAKEGYSAFVTRIAAGGASAIEKSQ